MKFSLSNPAQIPQEKPSELALVVERLLKSRQDLQSKL